MSLKTLLKAINMKTSPSRLIGRKLVKSYVSLFLVLMLGVVSTFAWFTEYKSANINSGDLEFQSASSLRINKDKSASNRIVIEDFVLDESSSVDGRNIFFPLSGSFTETTDEMLFREGNMGDKDERYGDNCSHYVYKDFELKGTSGNTPVYIKSYKLTIEDGDTVHDTDVNGVYQDELTVNYTDGVPQSQTLPVDCPIRLAFISDSGTNPVVIDPSAQVNDYVENSDAVTSIDDNGVPMTDYTSGESFAAYYYGKTPLFVIPGGQNLSVTLVIWLEGTLGNCDKYIGKKLSVDIDIESNFAEMETIKFVDGTLGDTDSSASHWISNDNPIIACSYEDPFSDEGRWKTVIMSKSSEAYTWTCMIPKKAITEISFYRLSKSTDEPGEREGTIYNSWHTSANIESMLGNANISASWYRTGSQDLQTSRQMTDEDGNTYNSVVYTAVHGNGWSVTNEPVKRLSPCVGYWDYEGGSGSETSTEASTESSTEASGGGSSSLTYTIGISVNTGEKAWPEQNANSGSVLHFYTENGDDYTIPHTAVNRFEGSYSLASGDKIVGFYMKHSSGQTNIGVTEVFTVSRNYNVTYNLNNNDKLVPSSTT